MYEAHLRSLLSPLGIYDLEEHSASGAAVCALGTGLDTVSRRLEEIEREALTATAEGEGLARREMGGGQLRVIFPEVAGEPEDFDQIRKIILDILPCHLEVEFYFRYLTWAECEAAGYTWGQVEAAEYTWESFQLAVPPER